MTWHTLSHMPKAEESTCITRLFSTMRCCICSLISLKIRHKKALLDSDELFIWFSGQWGVPLNCASYSRYECHIVQGSCLGFCWGMYGIHSPMMGKTNFWVAAQTIRHSTQHSTAHHSSKQASKAHLSWQVPPLYWRQLLWQVASRA